MSLIAFDTETTGLYHQKGDRPFCISFTDENMESWFIRWGYNHLTREVGIDKRDKLWVQGLFNKKDTLFIAHNAKFDIHMLNSIGIDVPGPVIDTVVLARIENNMRNTYKLKPLCWELFGYSMGDERDLKDSVIKARRKGKKLGWKLSEDVEGDYALGDEELCKKYCIGDTERCIKLWKYCIERLDESQEEALLMENQLFKVVLDMERKGIKIDLKRLEELKEYYSSEIVGGNAFKKILGYEDLNTKSWKQMQEVFYGKLECEAVYKFVKENNRKVKKLTTDKTALKKWAKTVPLAECIQSINTSLTQLNTFVLPIRNLIASDGRLHTNYGQNVAVTSRMSSSGPNLQNIPNLKDEGKIKLRIRELFIPENGKVLYFPDYSQIELFIAAFLSNDKVMCEALTNGFDLHGMFNEKFYGKEKDFKNNKEIYRKKVKTGVFCILYGGTSNAIMLALDCSRSEAQSFLETFWGTYTGLYEYNEILKDVAYEIGYIKNPFGRKFIMNDSNAWKALNTTVQSTAGEVLKRGMINVYNYLKNLDGCNLILTLHDELCIEVPLKYHSKRLMRKIIELMQGDFHTYIGMPFKFPVTMSWTPERWSETKEVEL